MKKAEKPAAKFKVGNIVHNVDVEYDLAAKYLVLKAPNYGLDPYERVWIVKDINTWTTSYIYDMAEACWTVIA